MCYIVDSKRQQDTKEVIYMAGEIFSLEQVAKKLNVSKRTITRQIEAGKLVGFKVGKSWRFRSEALDDYIRGQEATAKEDAASEDIDDVA
jgi:excisionase family DNA binding protein